jgi:hypothetical protein
MRQFTCPPSIDSAGFQINRQLEARTATTFMSTLVAAATARVHFIEFLLKSFQGFKFDFNNFHL